jgi:hypothetical protein
MSAEPPKDRRRLDFLAWWVLRPKPITTLVPHEAAAAEPQEQETT